MKSYKFSGHREAVKFWSEWIEPTIRILTGDVYDRVIDDFGRYDYRRRYEGREWFKQQHQRHTLHPAVCKMFDMYKPANWQRVILEWPHKSVSDPNRLAYTRDEKSAMYEGDSDKKALVTTIGKYLTRHWPDVPSDLIRDLTAEFTYGGTTTIINDMKRMVEVVSDGPHSCMSSRFDIRCDDGVHRHPYEVYDPSLGWAMAVRAEGSDVMGRCLVWTNPDDTDDKMFVRSYKREREHRSHSGADEAIESYLKGLGYTKRTRWLDQTPIMKYEVRGGGYLMPYLDGGTQSVEEDGDNLVIDSGGAITASSTSGIVSRYDCTCEDCGAGFDDGDGYWVGVYEDRHVCSDCCDSEYTYAYGRRGNQYYVNNNDVIEVGGDYYHDDYLSDNDIVELHDGEYEHRDNAVYIESEDAYYHCDDDDICYAEDTSRYELKDDCWKCAESGNYYTDDEDSVEVDGESYHPDHAPEPKEEETVAECVWTPHVTGPTETN